MSTASTPNPCIDCNRYMKFDKLYERARMHGLPTHIATGHYARIDCDEKRSRYAAAKRRSTRRKDQSYVLYDHDAGDACADPVSAWRACGKTEAREIAAEAGLINARKHDSQDICFVPDGDYAKVIESRTGKTPEPGPFLDLNGNVVGTHRGIIHYTVGQRRGLRMPSDGKIYVVKILPERNAVVVGPNEALFTRECLVPGMHWISGEAPALPFRCSAKTRYRQPEQPCTVYPAGETGVRLVFDEPLRAITPGQSAVLYDGDTVLGGGIIAREESVC
ncbi:MAG: MnmA/TRMU family protein [Oscillospiraceae bacterium]